MVNMRSHRVIVLKKLLERLSLNDNTVKITESEITVLETCLANLRGIERGSIGYIGKRK